MNYKKLFVALSLLGCLSLTEEALTKENLDSKINKNNHNRQEQATNNINIDSDVASWLQQQEKHAVLASIQYNQKSGDLTITKEGVGKIYRERVKLPKGIAIEVLLNRYLRISDKLGKKFIHDGFEGNVESKHVLVDLNPFAIRENDVCFGINFISGQTIAGSGAYEGLQDLIDEVVVPIYQQEFDEKFEKIELGSRRLTARGPNRNGDYELTSGKSSIIYHPEDQSATLGRGWNQYGVKSTIISGSVEDGKLTVMEDCSEKGIMKWELKMQFDNTDPDKSYVATRIDN